MIRRLSILAVATTATVAMSVPVSAQPKSAAPATIVHVYVPYGLSQPALSAPTAEPGVAAWQRIQARERRRAILRR